MCHAAKTRMSFPPCADQMFGNIQGLEEYTGCKVLHLEGNCLRSVQGLGHMSSLRALYIQSNAISSLEGLEGCTQLQHLDLSSNPIHSLSGLPPSLGTLHASNIGLESSAALSGLAEMCPSLQVCRVREGEVASHSPSSLPLSQVLDLSRNRLDATATPALCTLRALRVLYATDNPCSRSANFRRLLISSIPQLSYLDDQPVDELERCGCEAWAVGGRAAEAAARQAWREERRKRSKRTTATFAVERAQRRVLREISGG